MNLSGYVGKEFVFQKGIEEFEVYAEPGMKARIINVRAYDLSDENPKDHVYVIQFDFGEFEDFNAQYEQYNYYDNRGVPCLNARQAGFYEKVDEVYFSSPLYEDWSKYFEIADEFWFFDYQEGI
jgi:hypothetical protein